MDSALTSQDRVLGCLLGGALGDAWGGPFENTTGPLQFEIPSQSSLSDDTQLTLATCESILERGRVDPENVASHFLRWFKARKLRGIGASTFKAMRDLAGGAHWTVAGRWGEYAAGNGAAMRIAPLAFLLDPAIPYDRTLIRYVSQITHRNDEAYVGALAIVVALRSVLTSTWSPENSFLKIAANSLPDSGVRDRIEQLLPLRQTPAEVAAQFGATGYAVDSVPLALYCAQFISEHPLPTVLSHTIEAGGDTDTIASITGQLAGTVVGESAISRENFAAIDGAEEMLGIAVRFAEFIGNGLKTS